MQAIVSKAADLGGKTLSYRKSPRDPNAGTPPGKPADAGAAAKPKDVHNAPIDQPADPLKGGGKPADAAHVTDSRGIDPRNRGTDSLSLQNQLRQGHAIANQLSAAQAQAQARPQPHADMSKPSPAKPEATTDLPSATKCAKRAVKKPHEEEEGDVETVNEDEPDLDARRTGDRGTKDKGKDAADAEKKKADTFRKRGKKIGVMARLRQRWGVQATVILKAMQQRERLRQAWASVAPNLFAHHLVPVTVLKSNEVAQAAVVGGYDFNGKVNGRLLNHEEHAGGHNEYNQIIVEEMDHFARENPGYSPKQARDFLESRVGEWGKMYVKSVEYVYDTSDPGTAKR